MRWIALIVVAACSGASEPPAATKPTPPAPDPAPAPTPTPTPVAVDAAIPPAPTDAAPSPPTDSYACTTDADCPKLACGPCKTDDVVTHHDTSIKCFRNPCPTAKAHCADHVCKIQ